MFTPIDPGQLTRIVQSLAEFPGSATVEVISKRLPRMGPSERESTYQERTFSFAAAAPSVDAQALEAWARADDIVLTVRGCVSGPRGKDRLMEAIESFRGTVSVPAWDVRVRFQDRRTPDSYELTILADA